MEKDYSLPGDPASPRGTRLLPAGPSLQLERGTRGHSMWGQPRAEMDTKKVNTNASTVDPLMALKTTVLQAQLWGWKTSALLLAEDTAQGTVLSLSHTSCRPLQCWPAPHGPPA